MSGILIFNSVNQQLSQCVRFPIINDDLVEDPEDFSVFLEEQQPFVEIVDPSSSRVVIISDDGK